jgi:DNA-binding MarR family transcriptional regulator
MKDRQARIVDLIAAIRRAFQRLRRVADDLHRDIEITAAMRAVLEDLSLHGPRTVPQIAAAKDVSRQHIQQIVDGLAARQLVSLNANPNHRRSSLAALTPAGRKVFAEIARREAAVIADLARTLDPDGVKDATAILTLLREALEPHDNDQGDDDDSHAH